MSKLFKLLFFCLIFTYSDIHAQFFVKDEESTKLIQSSILGVVKEEVEDKESKKYHKDPDLLKQYENELNTLNKYIKTVMDREWKFSQKIEYLTQEQADKILEEKNEKYCLLKVIQVQNYKMNDFYKPGSTSGFNTPQAWAYHMELVGHGHGLVIKWAGEPKKNMVASAFPIIGLSEGTITFMIDNLQNQLHDINDKGIDRISDLKKDVKSRAPKLKNKTLYIPKSLMADGLIKQIEKGKLDKYYQYKYKVVDNDELENAILSKDKEVAYLSVMPAYAETFGKELYNYFIVDAEDSRFLFMTGSAVAGANGKFHHGQLMMAEKDID